MNEDFYTMWLSEISGIKRKQAIALMEAMGSAENVWKASREEIIKTKILPMEAVDLITYGKDPEAFENRIFDMEELGIRYISINSSEYPNLLREISDPPLGIYIKGQFPDKNYQRVAIIGARRCTSYGSLAAEKLSKDLVKRNVVIVSGMARGIDSKAHLGAIEGGGYTIAVLGCGLDICYPPENKGLMDRIIQNGCVISEFPPGTPPLSINFPQRNRIISGLCTGIVVVEAEKRSGTLITVQQALDNGRTVFSVPGNITSVSSQGTNQLIKEGAPVVTSAEDVFNELGIEDNINIKLDFINKISEKLENDEKEVYDCINMEPTDIETISGVINDSVQNVQYILTMLELKGYIKKIPGEKYVKSI